jgi:tetratricopeptide (TPR) repeat protein
LAKLAEYQLRANRLEEAHANLDEAEQLAETTDEKMHLAEIIRLRGRFCQAKGDYDQARLRFERAIACSRQQRARLFELNAARDLAKLCSEPARPRAHFRRCALSWIGFQPPSMFRSSPNAAHCCNKSDLADGLPSNGRLDGQPLHPRP